MTVVHTAAAWTWLARDGGIAEPVQLTQGFGWACRRPCCDDIARMHGGNAQWGDPLVTHQRTIKHVANEFGITPRELRDAVETIRPEFDQWEARHVG
jgi:hypothetical protein